MNEQMRFAEDELKLIKTVFSKNEPLLKLLRKVFLPSYDPKSPFGQGVDLWMTVDVRQMTPDQAYTRLLARNELIMHVEQQLLQLQALANMKVESEEEKEVRKQKDSTK